MDTVTEYASMPRPSILLAACAALALPCILARSGVRLRVALAEMAFVMTAAQLRGLGDWAMLAKVSSGFALALVGWAAAIHPGGKRRLAPISWLHAVVAIASIVCVLSVEDRAVALPLRIQWCALVVAALLVCRTIVDRGSLEEVMAGLLLGLCGGTALALSPLALDPGQAFRPGFGRFSPFECNPNQIAVTFALTAPLALYFAVASRRALERHFLAAVALAAVVGVVLTVSRMGMATVTVSCLPCLLRSVRKPAVALTLVLAAAVGVDQLQRAHTDQASFEHLELASQTERLEYIALSLEEVSLRPWFGLATSQNAYAHEDELNAHNAYVEMLYLGGLAYAVPHFLLLGLSAARAIRCWRQRRRLAYNNLCITTLAALYCASIVNGLVNNIIHYPFYSWAFTHVLLCHAFIAIGGELTADDGCLTDVGGARRLSTRSSPPSRGRAAIALPTP